MIYLLIGIIFISFFLLVLWRRLSVEAQKIESKREVSSFVVVRGQRIHYKQAGKGQNLVLIHGLGASIYAWRLLIPLLSTHFRVTAIDLLGFGQSDKPRDFSYNLEDQSNFVLLILQSLEIQHAYLVGSSMGGLLSLWIQFKYPDRFQRTVVISPALIPEIARFNYQTLAGLSVFLKPVASRTLIMRILKRVVVKQQNINAESIHNYFEPYHNSPNAIHAFIRSVSAIKDPQVYSLQKNLRHQTLILWGEKDQILPVHYLDKLQKLNSNMLSEIHTNGGHHLMEDEPDWVFQKICDFFET